MFSYSAPQQYQADPVSRSASVGTARTTTASTGGVTQATATVVALLQEHESLSLEALSERLPDLSTPKLQTILDVLCMTGTITLMQHSSGEDGDAADYAYSFGSEAASVPDTACPLRLGSLADDIACKAAEAQAIRARLEVLEPLLTAPETQLQPSVVISALRSFIQHAPELQEEPLFALIISNTGGT